jgi:hypothetical protein
MKLQTQLVIALFSVTTLVADEPRVIIPTLSIDQQIFISDNNGVLNAASIIRLKPSDTIKFILSDGTELTGLVKETEEINKEMFKVYGDIQNKPNTGFGFALVKAGQFSKEPVFAGAVVFRDTEETYTVQYSEEAKGFMLIKSKGKKTELKIAKKNSKNSLTVKMSVL